MPGRTASIDSATPNMLTSKVRRSVSSARSGTRVSVPKPAHATSTSTGPERRFDLLDGLEERPPPGDVGGFGDERRSGAAKFACQRLQARRVDIDQAHAHAVSSQFQRGGAADAVGRARDQDQWEFAHG